MRVADLIISSIAEAGTNTIFSLSGNQIMSLYDAAYDQDMTIIHARHEAGAVFMADGFARSSHRTGVALCTAGPGFTNAIGPLYALMASESPVVLITGDSPVHMDGRRPFQELNQTAISAPLVKESWRLTNSNNIDAAIREAMHVARSGRHGPVHLAIPEDVLNESTQSPLFPPTIHSEDDSFVVSPSDLSAITMALDASQKPVILTGSTISSSRNRALIDAVRHQHKIPVIAMTSPRGLADPMLGRIKDILAEADGIILLDKEPDFVLGFGSREIMPAQRIIVCAAQSGTVTLANQVFFGNMTWGCIADPVSSMKAIAKADLRSRPQAWLKSVEKRLTERPAIPALELQAKDHITPAMVIRDFAKIIDLSAPPLIVCDGGEFSQWVQSGLPDPINIATHTLTNGPSGGIGGAIPQAIGMAFANPRRHVVAFMGDGSAGFHLSDIETARRAGLPITFIVGNDQRWGAEVEIQKKQFGDDRVHSCDLDAETRYDLIAEGLGAKGYFVDHPDTMASTMATALNDASTSLINIAISGVAAPKF